MAPHLISNGTCRFILSLCALVVLSFCHAPRLGAQVTGGTILGTVSDSSGAVVPAVEISISNTATGLVTNVSTNKEGYYSAPNLLPGPYQVTAKATGFSTVVVDGVPLTVGAQQTVNVVLKVGETSQRVEVTDTALAVDLATSTVSEVVTGPTVRELPLNGRSWTDLAQLQPGVNAVHTQAGANTTDRASRGWGVVLTISGARPTQNNYRLNGVSLNDSFNAAPGTFLAGNLGVDAIGEFSVLTGNFSAEYGKSSGGIINAITKSGTNTFHGTAYEFLRNSAMDAKNFFDPPGPIAPFRRNQFGGAAGGPIQKDKTFIFGDYEGLRQSLSVSQVANVPSAAARQGNLCVAPDCATTAPFPIDRNIVPYLPLWPLPNGPLLCPFASCVPGTGDVGFYSFAGSQVTGENFYTFRVDRKFSENDSLFGTYVWDRQTQNQSDSLNDVITSRFIKRQTYTVEESHVFGGGLINVVRIGFNRQAIDNPSGATALNPIAADKTLGLTAGQTIGRIVVNGLTPFQGGLTLWQAANLVWNSYQGYDDVFITRGIHSLKIGFALERDQRNTSGPGGFAGGWSTFSNYRKFLSASPVSLIANSGGGDLFYHIHQWIWGAYVQDDMRLTPHLTVNAGLRYEFGAALDTTGGGTISALQCQSCEFPIMRHPVTSNPVLARIVASNDPNAVYGPLISNMPRLNFAPRVGVAWDPFGDGKTAVRAAFGVYDVLVQFPNYGSAIGSSWPGLQSTNTGAIPAGTWPKGTFSANSVDINTKRVDYIQQNPPTNYALQWNLSVQHSWTNTLSTQLAYVGTHTLHNVFQHDDTNIAFPNLASGTPLWPCGAITLHGASFDPTTDCALFGSFPRLNPFVGREPTQLYNSSGIYHGLQVGVFKRMGHGLMVNGSYTFAKNIDTSSGTGIGDPYVNSISSNLYYWDPKLRRSLSDTDIRHNLVLSYSYTLPTPSSAPGFLKAVVGGWETGAIVTIQGGQPFTPLISGDSIGENNTDPINFPDRLTGGGCQSLINPGNVLNYLKLQFFVPATPVVFRGTNWLRAGNAGRNVVIGPGLGTVDFSLFKNNYIPKISESFNAQFRFEAFNVLNRPNFSPPTDNEFLFDQSGGTISGAGAIDLTTTTSRQLQVALKIIW